MNTPTSHTTTGKVSTPTKLNEPPADDSSYHKPTPISQHVRSTQRLMNLISSRTDVDHPLCAECTHLLLTSLARQLDETKKERDGYIAFEKEVKKEKEREKDGLTPQEAEKKIAKLVQEEKAAITQLREVEKEREQLEAELRALELEEKGLEEEEAESVALQSLPVPATHCHTDSGERTTRSNSEPPNRYPNSLLSRQRMLPMQLRWKNWNERTYIMMRFASDTTAFLERSTVCGWDEYLASL
jgi:hypothetical protein